MMSALEKNLKALQEFYPEYHYETDGQLSEMTWNISLIETKETQKALVVDTGTDIFRMNSIYRPVREAEKWADQYDFSHRQVNIIIFGLGSGLFVREVLKRMQSDARCFIYEPDDRIFGKMIQEQDMTDIIGHPQVMIIFAGLGEDFYELLHPYVNWLTISHQVSCIHSGYEKLYPAEVQEYEHQLARLKAVAEGSRKTNAWQAHLSVENTIKNFCHIRKSNYLRELHGILDDSVSAIIVSAGPSLDKNIEMLEKAKGKAVIFATDTAVQHLEKRNIFFDCTVCIDTRKPVKYFEESTRYKTRPLFCSTSANAEILRMHRGRKIWYTWELLLGNLYRKYNHHMERLPVGGSVATAAVGIAKAMGIRNIILVGQDLAYGEYGTHAGGQVAAQGQVAGSSIEENEYWVEDIYGNPVRTRGDWLFYLNWFEEQGKRGEIHIIDATEGGAKIHGSEIMSLENAIDQYCRKSVDFEKALEELPLTFSEAQYESIREDLFDIKSQMNEIRRYTASGISFCKEYLKKQGKMSKSREETILAEIKNINAGIDSQELAIELVDTYATEKTQQALEDINTNIEDEQEEKLKSVKTALAVYQAFADAVDELGDILMNSLSLLFS